jgi:hypothetical protein
MRCVYLNTQSVPHCKHNSLASWLLLKWSKEIQVTGNEIGSVGLRWCITSQRKFVTNQKTGCLVTLCKMIRVFSQFFNLLIGC